MTSATVFPTGTRLARYTTEALIGRGGMSVVYAAYDHQLDRSVALKVMAPPIGDDDRFRKRFLRESRLAASIDHPNVIPIYDADEVDGRLYIAMRLVQGTDLRGLLQRDRPLEPARALAIVAQAADALDAAHARGLLHRDVKPANILVASDEVPEPHVYLSDFGLAVSGAAASGLEGSGFQGSADYVAPEQIEGRPEPASDLYALACVLFECLTGEPPFGRGRLLETLWRHLNEEPPRLADRRPDWPARLDDMFDAALAKNPASRPATCAELVSQARTARGVDRTARSHTRLGATLAAVVLGAAVLAYFLVPHGQRGTRGGQPREGTIVTLAGTGTSGSSGDGGPAAHAALAEPFALAVDRAGNVYVSEGVGGRVRRIDPRGTITAVAGTGEAVSPDYPWDPARPNLGIGPDGRLYIVRVNAPALRRLDRPGALTTVAGTGKPGYLEDGPRTLSPDLCNEPSGPAFDRTGHAYIACIAANRVIRIDRRGVYTTVAGTGAAGYSGDNGPATKAALNAPRGIAIDRHGNLYISDFLNNRVRKVDSHGIITTFAGNGLTGLSGDGWPAASVQLWQPTAVAVDAADNVYIVEAATSRIRKVDPQGVMTTIAGTGQAGFSGDRGPADRADLQNPSDVAVDARGNLYIADRGNNRIRKVERSDAD